MARITALVHFSMPWRNAGSERVLDELLTAAAADGHEVTCVVTDNGMGPVTERNGYRVERVRNVVVGANRVRRSGAQLVVTHHQNALYGIRQARLMGARSVYLTHNDMDGNKRPLAMAPSLVIHNTDTVAQSLTRFPAPGSEHMVMRPVVDPDAHHVPVRGDAITLVNLNEHKGARLFYALAEQMPGHRFLGVVGGHGTQIIRRDLPNVTIRDHADDMRDVWAASRVLLMPSVYESYGLVAAEAAVSGIPTVAARTPGLVENLGDAGVFVGGPVCEPDHQAGTRLARQLAADPVPWMLALLELDDPVTYSAASDRALDKALADQGARGHALATWTTYLNNL